MIDKFLGKFLNFMKGFSNLIHYFKVVWNDRDSDYFYILEIIKVKLQRVEQYWGVLTSYENDFHDKEKLSLIIKEIETFQIDSFNKTEIQNKKECSILLGKVGRLIPNLWD